MEIIFLMHLSGELASGLTGKGRMVGTGGNSEGDKSLPFKKKIISL